MAWNLKKLDDLWAMVTEVPFATYISYGQARVASGLAPSWYIKKLQDCQDEADETPIKAHEGDIMAPGVFRWKQYGWKQYKGDSMAEEPRIKFVPEEEEGSKEFRIEKKRLVQFSRRLFYSDPFMEPRHAGALADHGLDLDANYKWKLVRDDTGTLVLIAYR